MDPKKTDKPTEEQNWAGPSGQRWLANAVRFEGSLQPIGDSLLQRAAFSKGQHVIDIGCGTGAMSLEIANRVAPGGSVTAIDISPDLIAEANRKIAAQKPPVPVTFLCSDAARAPLPPGKADVLVSRFGSMFFTDPYAAFTHLHSLLRPGGKLVLAYWGPAKENPWMTTVRGVVAAHFDLPTPPPRTPGPFAFEEPEYLHDILNKASFKNIEISKWPTEMYVGGPGSGPESSADFLLQAMSVAQRAVDAPETIRNKVRDELVAKLTPFNTPNGVRMSATASFATATA